MKSSTGYLQNINTLDVFDHEIFLGNVDSPDNYREITKEEYDARCAKIKEELKKYERY